MCTGDKLETAENIGYACKLLNSEMDIIKCSDLNDVLNEFNEEKAVINEKKVVAMKERGMLIEAGALSKDLLSSFRAYS